MDLQSQEINEIAKALSLAQSELGGTEKDGKNPHFKCSYSTLQACLSVTREPLAKNGLALTQQMDTIDGKPYLITSLIHTSGQWLRSYSQLILEKPTCQGMGSSISYFRRYSLCALLGLFQEDDDGEKASRAAKAAELCSQNEYDEFILEWSEYFTPDVLIDFIKTKGSKFKLSSHEIVAKEKKDIELFKKNVQAFVEWKEKNLSK